MLSRFQDYLQKYDLAGPTDRVLLAVSGGLDSMVMLHLFRMAKFEVGVAHGNFGLRGKESDGDEVLVSNYCAKHKIPFYSNRFDTKNYAETHHISLQMAARELRYRWFDELLIQERYHWLATAHHLNDNVETVLLRWSHGSGLDQLCGIPRKNDRIIRPLLFAGRPEIEAFARDAGIVWREDSSNLATHYQRNFMRHEVIPKLKEINPSLETTFGITLEKLEGAAELMRRSIEQLRDSMTRKEGRELFIDKNLLLLLQHPAFVCYEWLKEYGFEFDRCKQLVSAAAASQTGARFLALTHVAVVDRDQIIVSPRSTEEYHDVLVEDWQDKAALGPWMMHFHLEPGSSISRDPMLATVDYAKVRFPLLWRKWKPGDAFMPLGMKNTKKISDFLVDEQVPLMEKGRVTVVTSGDDIVWVAGYRVDERFKVTPKTTKVLTMLLRAYK
ncbi:MAG: tRNA lysidine(34) synthetase TilS [Cyclobacteriaceae bacterium]|nr:tRNA lysidine(34) synthetase TilS [Cyclobacteriaceae bacterium]